MSMAESLRMDIVEILRRLPHRYPFLLVDRVLDCTPGGSIRALKNVTYNEPYFPGHFPHRPVMPGVMIIEALAQTAGILVFATIGTVPDETTKFYFVGIDKARFRRPVEPGDQLILTAKVERSLRGIWKLSTSAWVGEEEAAHADMMIAPETEKSAPVLAD
jgi:3-hydroxyacyl-[acyl-carrier-protein] dehydratase